MAEKKTAREPCFFCGNVPCTCDGKRSRKNTIREGVSDGTPEPTRSDSGEADSPG
jgi:hypothetical protein